MIEYVENAKYKKYANKAEMGYNQCQMLRN